MTSGLIVDDSRVIRKVSRQILEAFGFACAEAENGQFALDYCKQTMPDFVLLDRNMPVMNGIDFLKSLRKEPNGDKPIVVVCTTENDVTHIQEALDAGANEYIMKPFDADIVKSKLMQLELIE